MILVGDFIDMKVCLTFGFTTMAPAGIGNTISDVIGIWGSGLIETGAAMLGLPDHGLTHEQQKSLTVRILKNTSMIVGIVIGCILGMFPLAYPDEYRLWPSREQLQEKAQE